MKLLEFKGSNPIYSSIFQFFDEDSPTGTIVFKNNAQHTNAHHECTTSNHVLKIIFLKYRIFLEYMIDNNPHSFFAYLLNEFTKITSKRTATSCFAAPSSLRTARSSLVGRFLHQKMGCRNKRTV